MVAPQEAAANACGFAHAGQPLVSQAMNDIADQVRAQQAVSIGTGPKVLQVVPELSEGGAERGTVDLARYLIREGWTALVASAGGSAEAELKEAGATTFRLPLHSKNPFTDARPTSAACSA